MWSITSENGRTIDLVGYHGRVKEMARPSTSETEKLTISVLARTIGRATSETNEMANNMKLAQTRGKNQSKKPFTKVIAFRV